MVVYIIKPIFAGFVKPATKFLIALSSALPCLEEPTPCCEALSQFAVLSKMKRIFGAGNEEPGGC